MNARILIMNISSKSAVTPEQDPLGLGELGALQPDEGRREEDWAAISAALDADDKARRNWWIGGLAAAASVAFVVMVANLQQAETTDAFSPGQVATTGADPGTREEQQAPAVQQPTTNDLIAMSQQMEQQLHDIRSQVGSMPSELVIYQVELQDLIGQVDEAISMSPDSEALWGQRIGLQMDLMKLYRNQLRRDYHRLASV